jgi:hypothetical protein
MPKGKKKQAFQRDKVKADKRTQGIFSKVFIQRKKKKFQADKRTKKHKREKEKSLLNFNNASGLASLFPSSEALNRFKGH